MADRENVIKRLSELHGSQETMELISDTIAMLKAQPDIVRCEGCRWWDNEENSVYGYCRACQPGYRTKRWEIDINRKCKGDWFCADGERR